MSSTESKQYFVYPLTLVKGICILGVILIHVGMAPLGITHIRPLTDIIIFATCLGYFAVPIFIIVSGFYLSLNRRNELAIPFYHRTLRYLIMPYILFSLVYSFPAFLKKGSVLQVAINLVSASASAHLWFGLLILQLYVLHPYLSRWFRKRQDHKKVIFFAFLLQISYSLSLSIVFKNPDPMASIGGILHRLLSICFVSNIGYFLFGYYLLEKADDMVRIIKDKRFIFVGGLASLLASLGLFYFWGISMSEGIYAAMTLRAFLANSLFIPVMSLATLPVIFSIVQNMKPKHTIGYRVLHSFGLYSYGIYYLHILVFWVIAWIVKQLPIIRMENALLKLILFLVTAFMTLISVKLLSKLPFSRYLI